MGLFAWSTNKQKYNNNISIKKAYKQVNRQQQHCKQLVYIYRDFAKKKTFSFKCIHQTANQPSDIKGKIQSKQRQLRKSCVKTRYVWRE